MASTTHQQTWRLFIDAKKKLTSLYEQPLTIVGEPERTAGGFSLTLDQTFTRQRFYGELKKQLGLKPDQINTEAGLFFLDWQTTITSSQLEKITDVAAACYFDFEPQPFLSGSAFLPGSKQLSALVQAAADRGIEIKPDAKQMRLQFPPEEHKEVRKILGEPKWRTVYNIAEQFQIVLAITPNYSAYLDRLLTESGLDGKVNIYNKRVGDADQLLKSKIKAKAPISREAISYIEGRGFTHCFEEGCHKFTSIKDVKGYKAIFYREHQALQALIAAQPEVELRQSSKNDYLIFNLSEPDVFEKVLTQLQALNDIRVFYQPSFTIAYLQLSPGDAIRECLNKLSEQFPSINCAFNGAGYLTFQYFFDFDGRVQNRLAFMNALDELATANELEIEIENVKHLHFVARENKQLKAFQETDRLSRLVGEEFATGQGRDMNPFGTLKSIRFPKLAFESTIDILSANDRDWSEIRANLKGEREKIERLNQTMDKLAGDGKLLPNPLSKSFVFDSASARPPANPELLEEGSQLWEEVVEHSYQNLNPSQIRAVVSTLLAPDLALVQGPPGTGKSTAISQIIWHHIRQNPQQHILLTSETNMAVDNAIEKLEHPIHNLVKPVRIGKEANLETEGSRYSLTQIKAWVLDPDTGGDNAVARWLPKIAARAAGKLTPELQVRWNRVMTAPAADVRELAQQMYIRYANVIASTGSFIGEVNSEGSWTGFYRQYLQILKERPQPLKSEQPQTTQKPRNPKIAFDVVVMDEASKATPPELALPITYSKKAIVIGDHRQLPPLLDEEEFEAALNGAGGTALAQDFLLNKEAQVSQFERLFLNNKLDNSLVSRFNRQYRMHPHINEVIKQFYVEDGGLECGIPASDADDVDLKNPLSRYHGFTHDGFIDPGRHLIWVDVDEPEMKEGSSRVNFAEVEAVRRVLTYLQKSDGFKEFQDFWGKPEEKEIGLISFYGKQLFYLDQLRQEFGSTLPMRVRTVDRFQGMERNIIIVSMVRSNKIISGRHQAPDINRFPSNAGYPQQTSLGFAEFPNRLNVALSRAKRLLIMVGNSKHFCQHDCYRRVFEQVQQLGVVIDYKRLNDYLQP